MDVPAEELEPLFDYSRVQPIDLVSSDDDSPVMSPVFRSSNPADGKGRDKGAIVNIEDDDERKEDKEEDWLPPPPPKVPGSSVGFTEDKTLQELRLHKQELASFAQSAEAVLKTVIESVRREIHSSRSDLESEGEPLKPQVERQKIIITIQDKAGQKQFRVYKGDKFERLFKMYAERVEINLESLVFCFDGEKVSPSSSPDSLGMEDDDMIEVHVKSH